MNKPNLKIVENDAPPVPGIETVSASIHKSAETVRLAVSFTSVWTSILAGKSLKPSGNLDDGLLLKLLPPKSLSKTHGVYQPNLQTTGVITFVIHRIFIGRDLKVGDTVPLLSVDLSSAGITLRAVPRNLATLDPAGTRTQVRAQRSPYAQGRLPLEVPPAGNLIEQLRIALGNVNSIAADIPGLALRVEDGRVRAGFDL